MMSVVMSLARRNPFSSSIKEMVTTFSTSTYKVGLKLLPNEQDARVPVLVWATCAYTIQTIGTTHERTRTQTPSTRLTHAHAHSIPSKHTLFSRCFNVVTCRAPPGGRGETSVWKFTL